MAKIFVRDRDGETHEVEARSGVSLMESLREQDFGVEALCGGMCSCATCHCYVAPEWSLRLNPRQDDELELLEELECFKDGSRLSCQVEFTEDMDGLEITIAPEE